MPRKLKSNIYEKHEKEFLEAFAKKAIAIKEKKEKEKIKEEQIKTALKEKAKVRKARAAEKIALSEKRLRPSIREEEEKKARAKLKEISIEHMIVALPEKKPEEIEKEKKEKMPAPKPSPGQIVEALSPPIVPKLPVPTAPLYQRVLPPLPKPPKITPTWPLPPPLKITKAPTQIAPAVAPTIDLGKLNTFIQDATVMMIQCDGANLPIKIKKEGKLQETVVTLSEDEIKLIIKKFADRTNQPILEPIFKTQLGNLTITAVISAYAGSKFVISKT